MSAVILLTVEIFTQNHHSLKDKRQVLHSIRDRLHQRFNVSVAETDYLDKWQRSQLSIVSVGQDRVEVEARLARVIHFLDHDLRVTILDHKFEALK
jgi:hypothetical protein